MKIRFMGLPGEVDQAITIISAVQALDVVQVDGPYPNRGRSRMVRLYVEVQLSPDSGVVP